MIRTCQNCGAAFAAAPHRGSPKKWCSAYCKRRRGRAFADGSPITPRPTLELTALNIATTARYLACGNAHTFTVDRWIIREVAGRDHVMLVCEVCEVPISTRYLLWNGKVSAKGYDGSKTAA